MISIRDWEPKDAEGWLSAFIYTILYRGPEHPWILVSAGGPRTNPLQVPWDNLISEGVKRYMRIFNCTLNPSVVQGQLY